MNILINSRQVDYILVSPEIKGLYDSSNNTSTPYSYLPAFTKISKQPTWLETLFGKRALPNIEYPAGYYENGDRTGAYILEKDINPQTHVVDGQNLYTRPFYSPYINGKSLGTVHFNTYVEALKQVKKRFGNVGLKHFNY